MPETMVELVLTRDSVCMADDIEAPHRRTILLPGDASPLAIVKAIQRSGYPAHVGLNATWSVRIGAGSIVFGTRYGLSFAWPAVEEPGLQARDVGPLFLSYHQQTDPRELLHRMRGKPL